MVGGPYSDKAAREVNGCIASLVILVLIAIVIVSIVVILTD